MFVILIHCLVPFTILGVSLLKKDHLSETCRVLPCTLYPSILDIMIHTSATFYLMVTAILLWTWTDFIFFMNTFCTILRIALTSVSPHWVYGSFVWYIRMGASCTTTVGDVKKLWTSLSPRQKPFQYECTPLQGIILPMAWNVALKWIMLHLTTDVETLKIY